MFRPQYPFAPPRKQGFVYQPCIYQFTPSNTPGLGAIAVSTGQETSYIPLQLDKDAEFVLLGAKIEHAGLNVLLWDPFNNPLMDSFVTPAEYAAELQPFTVLEGGRGVECPPGSAFQVKFQGQ
jgi:hypothetical protein